MPKKEIENLYPVEFKELDDFWLLFHMSNYTITLYFPS